MNEDNKQRRAKIQKLRQSLKRIRKGRSSENESQHQQSWFSRLKARLGLDNSDADA